MNMFGKQMMKIKVENRYTNSLLSMLFYAIFLSVSFNSFAQKNGTEIAPTIESIEPNTKHKKDGAKAGPIITDTKSNDNAFEPTTTSNAWRDYKTNMEKEAGIKFNSNIDSLYQSYASQRFFISEDEPDVFQVKIIPNYALNRILNNDTMLYRYIKVHNSLFSSVTISSNKIAAQIKKHFPLFTEMSKDFKITTYQLFNQVIPPVLVGKPEMNITYYQKLIDNYFISNPEVIYYCSNDFLRMLVRKQYTLMYSLHKESANAVNAKN